MTVRGMLFTYHTQEIALNSVEHLPRITHYIGKSFHQWKISLKYKKNLPIPKLVASDYILSHASK